MKKTDKIKIIIATIILAILIFYVGINTEGTTNPRDAYFVYLDGAKIGMISDKQALLDKINQEQEEIKRKYKVDQVFPPTGLEIVKSTTFDKNYLAIDDIYNKINDFSIKGYVVTIDSPDEDVPNQYLYIQNKDYFNESMQKLITAFIPEEKYLNYINETQEQVTDVGEYINNIYLYEKITIKEANISTKNNILTTREDISRYLLYGTSSENKKYTVRGGDTLESIAERNNLNVTELLIANPELKEKGALLSSKGDQTLNVSLINPIVSIVTKAELIERQVAYYETVVKYDNKLTIGTSYIEQKGENGVAKVKYNVEYVNGEIVDVKKISSMEISIPVNKIIVRGGFKNTTPILGDPEDWGRPTVNYCYLSDTFRYRGGELHDAIDIAGASKGSPIFAANDGVVIVSGKDPKNANAGIHVRIDHQNGYITSYVHLSRTDVTVGQRVTKGQIIGGMGNTGLTSGGFNARGDRGVHLHFSIYYFPDNQTWNWNKQYALDPVKVSPAFRY